MEKGVKMERDVGEAGRPSTAESTCLVQHPLAGIKLAKLKDKATDCRDFRELMDELSQMICYEALRDFPWSGEGSKVQTKLHKVTSNEGAGIEDSVIIVPIMRAGMGMVNGIMRSLPNAKVGHIGMYRDKFINNTVEYYFRLPKDLVGKTVLLLDPILATGATTVAAISRLKDHGVEHVTMLTLMASHEGLDLVREFYPETKVFTFAAEASLDTKGFLQQGLGDVGHRLFGT